MAVDLGTLVVELWVELTLFVIVLPAGLMVGLGYKLKMPFILNLLRKRYIYHFIIDGVRVTNHIVMIKDTAIKGSSRFVPYGREWYLYKPNKEYLFYWNGVTSIAHRAHDPTPMKFSEIGNMILLSAAEGEYPAQEVHDAIESKVVTDFNASIYQKKEIITMIMIFGVCVLICINIYFTYTTQQQVASMLSYFARYFTANPAVP